MDLLNTYAYMQIISYHDLLITLPLLQLAVGIEINFIAYSYSHA